MNNRNGFSLGIHLAFCILLLAGCRFGEPDPLNNDTPTSGQVLILADADCRPVIDQELLVFSAQYPKAKVDIRYMSEAELLKAMLNDSVRCVITSVAPGRDQQAYFTERQLSAPVVPIYHGGIAVVTGKTSPIAQLDLRQIAAILGKTDTLELTSDIERKLGADSLQALFAGAGSGIARQLIDSLGIKVLRARALPDVAAVVAVVERDPRAIGFLPFEAISDLDDPAMVALREQVRLLPIARNPGDQAILPSQSTLADGAYPLQRTVHMVLTEGKSGLGTGFVSFVANHKGQRIILKLGVAPIKVPSRNVEIVHH